MDTLKRVMELLKVPPVADGQKMPIEVGISRDSLPRLFADLEFQVGAEIGVEQGVFTEQLMKAMPKSTLYGIDAWLHYTDYRDHVTQSKLDGFYAKTQERMKPFPGCTLVRAYSMDAVRDFPVGSLDYVYVDGNHGWDWVSQDIIEWARRVRKGGIVSGHDWIRRKGVDVVQATQMYTYCHDISPWFVTNEQGRDARTWFWVKPRVRQAEAG